MANSNPAMKAKTPATTKPKAPVTDKAVADEMEKYKTITPSGLTVYNFHRSK